MNFHFLSAAVCRIIVPFLTFTLIAAARAETFPSYSGIYPHLAFFNEEGECGTGAVVPWADRLWAITYSPHKPNGSSDKLYEIDSSLNMTIRPESVGGTPANRFVHVETNQLIIGPYVIDQYRRLRVIPPSVMPGRLTGNARHLSNPATMVYFATMEEGLYEVEMKSLAVRELYQDANAQVDLAGDLLPGYHGKGLYSGQGRLVYANNGEHSPEAMKRPDIPSGCLAEWDGTTWTVIRRNQFTEVTGPGGLGPDKTSANDPLWSIGWDHRSLILMMCDGGKWSSWRLPKSSHSYDGAHGWNTEWPRIRDIGEPSLLMTMHGCFWKFPKTFSLRNSAGISARSNYLKVIGDFCSWNGRLIFGCDDAARSEFLNKRPAKGEVAGPAFSQSNLWFLDPWELDELGPVSAQGAVWLNDSVKAGEVSDPFLVNGFERKSLHLSHNDNSPLKMEVEVDRAGDGKWGRWQEIEIPAEGYRWQDLSTIHDAQWIRFRAARASSGVTALLTMSNKDNRTTTADEMFDELALMNDANWSGGVVRAGGGEAKALSFAATRVTKGNSHEAAYYEMSTDMKLKRFESTTAAATLQNTAAVPQGVITSDEASVIIEEDGRRFRLPRNHPAIDTSSTLPLRIAREVCTERDLLNVHGTFFELPARNAGGLAKVRPISTHNRRITDYCSWRGLLVLTGITSGSHENSHIIVSDDQQAAVWVGAVDDLWKFGRPVGHGGPWKNTRVMPDVPSDPYLMAGYDRKTVVLDHDSSSTVEIAVEIDLTGDGDWKTYRRFQVAAGNPALHEFPDSFACRWIRTRADKACQATAWLRYE